MTSADQEHQNLVRLRDLLNEYFNREELSLLCFDLGIEYEDLAGSTRRAKTQNLVTYLQRRGALQRLINEVKIQRPNVNWPEFAPTKPITEDTAADTYTDEKTGLEMIRIPAGEFIYGKDNRLEYLPEFWIAKTPVTNAQYFRFVGASGRISPRHWEGKTPKAKIANFPVILSNWYGAKAYADWASMHLATEEEWEKAVRGDYGLIFVDPWSEYMPWDWSPGRNVWEWTASWEDGKHRVLRGGPQYKGQRGFYEAHPDHHDRHLLRYSFRMVRRPPF